MHNVLDDLFDSHMAGMFDELDAMCPPEPKIEEEAPIVEASPSESRAQIERAHKQRGKLNLGIKVYREGYNHRSHMTTKHLPGGNFNLLEPGHSTRASATVMNVGERLQPGPKAYYQSARARHKQHS